MQKVKTTSEKEFELFNILMFYIIKLIKYVYKK